MWKSNDSYMYKNEKVSSEIQCLCRTSKLGIDISAYFYFGFPCTLWLEKRGQMYLFKLRSFFKIISIETKCMSLSCLTVTKLILTSPLGVSKKIYASAGLSTVIFKIIIVIIIINKFGHDLCEVVQLLIPVIAS